MRPGALLTFVVAVATATAENDSWTWDDNKQKASPRSDSRYQVYEPSDLESSDNNGFRPQYPGSYGPNGYRPFRPSYPGGNGILVGPGGPSGIIGRPPRFEQNGHDGILNSVPPWIRDDPRYREFDTCKCRYSFNCPSPGLKFGQCSRDKKYCCFNSRRFPELLGEHYYPSTPHKFEPNGYAPNYYGNRRPQGVHQHSSFGDYYPDSYGGYGHRNEFESLRPYGYDSEPEDYVIYGRSLSKNQTQTNDGKPKTNEGIEKQ
ncbi:uncharacterized protein LOC109851765 [Pseudomyrmex gracilis]|uniref:uncharacterized protein LOC109851765 n=1 Tax=Pseudomyrmex gracilis TaxID=219809 RepID=UPI0009952EE9|nr:uncharacterized protein LOC109851765 [Pseudomyrmex gracilis]